MSWRGGCRGGKDVVEGKMSWRGGCRGEEDVSHAL
jgi:hypothetical protein